MQPAARHEESFQRNTNSVRFDFSHAAQPPPPSHSSARHQHTHDSVPALLPSLEDDWSSATFLSQLRENISLSGATAMSTSAQQRAAVAQSFRELFFPSSVRGNLSERGAGSHSSNTAQQRARVLLSPLFSNRLVNDVEESVRQPWVQCHSAIAQEVRAKLVDGAHDGRDRFLPSESQFAAALLDQYHTSAPRTNTSDEEDYHGGSSAASAGLLSTSGVRAAAGALHSSWMAWDATVVRQECLAPSPPGGAGDHSTKDLPSMLLLLRGAMRARLQRGDDSDNDCEQHAKDHHHQRRSSQRSTVIAAASVEADLAASTSPAGVGSARAAGVSNDLPSQQLAASAALSGWLASPCCPPLVTVSAPQRGAHHVNAPLGAHHGHSMFDPSHMAQRSVAASSAWYGGSAQYGTSAGFDGDAAFATTPSIVYAGTADEPAVRAAATIASIPAATPVVEWRADVGGAQHFTMPTEDEVEEDRTLAQALLAAATARPQQVDPAPSAAAAGDNSVTGSARTDGAVVVGAHQRIVFRNGKLEVIDKMAPKAPKKVPLTDVKAQLEAGGPTQIKKHKPELPLTAHVTSSGSASPEMEFTVPRDLVSNEFSPSEPAHAVGGAALLSAVDAAAPIRSITSHQAHSLVAATVQRCAAAVAGFQRLCDALEIGLEGV